MSDKNLTEPEWKKFSKGKDFKDAAFVKALAALGQATAPALQLDALADIEKQAEGLRKAYKADKDLTAYLDGLDKALDKQRKLSEAEARKSSKADDSGGDEEDTPALLTTKMVPLLRQVRKGEEMQVLLASVGKEVAVLIARRSISPTRRKLLTEYLDNGTPKFFSGHCIFEEAAYTFVMKTQAAGMAKKVKAALLRQVELRLKVRVRGEDPNDIDDDGDPAEDDAALAGADEQASPGASQTAPTQAPASAQALAYTQRLGRVQERLAQALRDQHPQASKLRTVIGFASEKAAAGDYVAATKALDMLGQLLDAPAGDAPGAAAAQAYAQRLAPLEQRVLLALRDKPPQADKLQAVMAFAGAKAAAKNYAAAAQALDSLEKLLDGMAAGARVGDPQAGGATSASQQRAAEAAATIAAARTAGGVGVVEFATMRLELQAVRANFDTAINSLKTAFTALLQSEDFVDDPRSSDPATLARIETIEQRLPSFKVLADSINDAIDDMSSASEPAQRRQHSEAALQQIADFRGRIDAEPMLTEMESSDAGSFPIHAAMSAALDKIATALRA